jgi:putrescine aminotransferase
MASRIRHIRFVLRENLVEQVRNVAGPYLQRRWAELAQHPLVGEVRGVGLLGALELVKSREPRTWFEPRGKVGERCRDNAILNGLVMRATRDTMIIAPPLVITPAEIDELVEKAWRTLDQTLAGLERDGWL